MHYTFEPFWESIQKRGINKYQLIHKYGISASTVDKLDYDKGLQLETICRICNMLDLRIDECVRVVDDSYESKRVVKKLKKRELHKNIDD